MALPPKFAAQNLLASADAAGIKSKHTLEIYLDYVCPFSAKLFNTLFTTPLHKTLTTKYASKLNLIIRQQIQPWHPSSTLTHEAALAVLKVAPEKYLAFNRLLFARQKEFYDANTVSETRNSTYKRLADLAAEVGVNKEAVYGLLWIKTREEVERQGGNEYNSGNGVTQEVKTVTKMNRLVGVHVTPTAVFDGVVENAISSSWSEEQWEEWLGKNVV